VAVGVAGVLVAGVGAVGVLVAVARPVGVRVTVFKAPVVRTSLGAFEPASRLPKAVAVLLAEVTARLTSPSPLTSDVTSTLTHTPDAIAPDVRRTLPIAGMLVYVIWVSLQVVLVTGRT
jgi:hypothetical protein